MKEYKACYRCGAPATDIHHIFNASNKKNSEKYGALIPLCRECHIFYHTHAEAYNRLRAVFQLQIMADYDLSIKEFREIFHKNYLGENDED